MPHTHRSNLRVPSPFELDVALRGHGWVALAPHRYEREAGRLHTTLDLAALAGVSRGQVVDVELQQTKPDRLELRVTARRPLPKPALEQVRAALRHSLALDVSLDPFWSRCAATPRLAWVPERGAGRLMRSPGLFEDLLKLLMTTNCTWANTKSMVERTTATLGRVGPSGARAFPSARVCAEQSEQFWREQIRVGYRAPHCRTLAERFSSGELSDADFVDPELSTHELRKRLLALPGFGPYAAGQALRLLGRFDDLALDSWVRKRAAELHGLTPGDDAAIARRYAEFERYAGLALWLDVTRAWHDDQEAVSPGPGVKTST
jgi:3-methyladenine DNA glycosylase/8-oxoguanine DNA glycosylase